MLMLKEVCGSFDFLLPVLKLYTKSTFQSLTIIFLGRGVFERSIAALLKLNKVGYGSNEHPELELDLVYNPGKPSGANFRSRSYLT